MWPNVRERATIAAAVRGARQDELADLVPGGD